jgi:hypothetical protein
LQDASSSAPLSSRHHADCSRAVDLGDEVVSERLIWRTNRGLQLIVASWIGSESNPPTGPYGLSVLDLTSLGITF